MDIIKAQGVRYKYKSPDNLTFALNGVDICVKKGEFVAIVGHNGSGKSTFAKHLNALLIPDEGSVYIDDMDTAHTEDLFNIRKTAGMVFQNPDNQIVATVVDEDVAFGPENLGIPREQIVERVNSSLKKVEMTKYAKHAPHMLSGGQKQRVAIAGALAIMPEIIVFDEPTAMLDPVGRQEVLASIYMLNKQMGKTIVLITHFMEEVAQADRVVVMNEGRIVLVDTPANVFKDSEILAQSGLLQPFYAKLYEELKHLGLVNCPKNSEELVDELCRLM